MQLKKHMIYPLVVVGIWFLLWLSNSWSVLELTNYTFMTGLICVTFFVVLKILHSGLFELFFYGMDQMRNFIFRKSKAQVKVENELKEDPKLQQFRSSKHQSLLTITLMTAMGSLVLSLVGLVLFYT